MRRIDSSQVFCEGYLDLNSHTYDLRRMSEGIAKDMGSPHMLRTTARGSQRRGARGGAAEARAAAAPDLSSRPLVFDAILSRPTHRAFSTHALFARSLLRVLSTLVLSKVVV